MQTEIERQIAAHADTDRVVVLDFPSPSRDGRLGRRAGSTSISSSSTRNLSNDLNARTSFDAELAETDDIRRST